MGFRDLFSGLFASRDTRQDAEGVYAGAIEIPDYEEAPDWIRLLQTGEYLSHPDGAHEVTQQHLEEIVENFGRTEVDLLVDKDHDSLYRGDTRAAGWIMEMEIRDDGLYGRWPEWTPWGEELVGSREYRYLSPVYSLTSKAKDGTAQGARMHSVSLTNVPYMDTGEVDAVSSPARTDDSPSDTTDTDPDRPMERDKLIDLLDLDGDATDEEIEEALQELKDESDESDPSAGDEPDEDDGSEPDDDSAGGDGGGDDASAEEDDLEAKVNSMLEQLQELKEGQEEDRAEELVDEAVADGKVLPSEKDVWANSARRDFEGTKEKLDAKEEGEALPEDTIVNSSARPDASASSENPDLRDYIQKQKA